MFRKTIFWVHLICGVATGVVVLMMSITGVILTYERQMLAWQARDFYTTPPAAAARASLQALLASAEALPDFRASSIRLASDPSAPVLVSGGPAGARYLDAYTAEVLGEPPRDLDEFFSAITGWHRWFNASGESRATWRAVTGISNIAFLFLIVSGLYLWLPRVAKWAAFRAHLLFNRQALRGKARDYNWHHVIGFWTAIPLAIVVATAVVFSYPWANNAVYRVFGEEPPARRGPAPAAVSVATGAVAEGNRDLMAAQAMPASPWRTLDALFERAAAQLDDWNTITVTLPRPGEGSVGFSIDQGNGGQPQRRHSLTLDAHTGAVISWQPFESQSPGRRARSWIRFLHTGEALGVIGQTVAGLVSLTSVVMVWTGLALAYRRLVAPLFRKRR